MPKNTLILMSDEHSRKVMGAYGNAAVHTPHLDALAARGTLFENAYCNSPICVPSRASLHTGLYPHQIRYWDNAMPFDGRVASWGHALQAAGRPVTSIGKLHFKDAECDTGFDEQLDPLHVKDGIGDPSTLLRRNPPVRPGTKQMAGMAGKGITPYWEYDACVAETAANWLRQKQGDTKGWTLFVSFVLPHFPLNAPDEFRKLYDRDVLPLPKRNKDYAPENKTVAAMRTLLDFQDHFTSDDIIREAVANYYALCSALDANIGKVLGALDQSGAVENTTVIYTSDHGDNLGARGYWGKSTLWEESVGVPMIIAGPDIPSAGRNSIPTSLIDLYPTICDLADAKQADGRPGQNLAELARASDQDRSVFAEYHAVGSNTGMFMLRKGRFKLIECVGDAPLLYDLEADPDELVNIANDPDHQKDLRAMQAEIRTIVQPDSADRQAFVDQENLIEKLGGEAQIRTIVPMAFTDPRHS